MPIVIATAPVFTEMNRELRRPADCVMAVTTGLGEFDFSRIRPGNDKLDWSFDTVAARLGAHSIGIPRGFASEDRTKLVNLYAGHGFRGDETNPNPSGMGLVTSDLDVMLAVTGADAPSATVSHPSGVIAAVSGIWHLLRYGTVRQTVALIERQVIDRGGVFRPQDLWVNLAAGAREDTFLLDEAGRGKALAGDCAGFSNRVIRVFGKERPYGLDLSGLFYDLWLAEGVSPERIGFDPRNTMTERDETGRLVLPSKRTAEELGNDTYKSAVHAIVQH